MNIDYYVKWSELDEAIKLDKQYTIYVPSNSNNSIYVTNNNAGARGFLIEFEPTAIKDYKPPKVNGLEINLCKKKNIDPNMLYLEVKNVDVSFDAAFIGFSVVLFDEISISKTNEATISIFEKTINAYHEIFKTKKELSKDSEQGLIAELLFLMDCITSLGEHSVKNWWGCEKNKRDFIFDTRGVEIKSSRNQEQDIIHVSNENQLDKASLTELELRLYIFDENESGLTVGECIKKVLSCLSTPEYKKIFISKVSLLGINPIEYTGKYKFLLEKIKCYCVDDSFPKITKNNIPNCAYDVKYWLNISNVACKEEVIK